MHLVLSQCHVPACCSCSCSGDLCRCSLSLLHCRGSSPLPPPPPPPTPPTGAATRLARARVARSTHARCEVHHCDRWCRRGSARSSLRHSPSVACSWRQQPTGRFHRPATHTRDTAEERRTTTRRVRTYSHRSYQDGLPSSLVDVGLLPQCAPPIRLLVWSRAGGDDGGDARPARSHTSGRDTLTLARADTCEHQFFQ